MNRPCIANSAAPSLAFFPSGHRVATWILCPNFAAGSAAPGVESSRVIGGLTVRVGDVEFPGSGWTDFVVIVLNQNREAPLICKPGFWFTPHE
jgi:hypothetical protein